MKDGGREDTSTIHVSTSELSLPPSLLLHLFLTPFHFSFYFFPPSSLSSSLPLSLPPSFPPSLPPSLPPATLTHAPHGLAPWAPAHETCAEPASSHLLADNCHYPFYVWKNIFRHHEAVKYLLVPAYSVVSLFFIHALCKCRGREGGRQAGRWAGRQ